TNAPSHTRTGSSRGNLRPGNFSSFATFEQVMTKIHKTDQEWSPELTPEQYRVLREKGTERAFTGEYDHVFEPGTYHCAGCGAELLVSDTKYDSGCGWPGVLPPAARGGA